MIAEKHAKEGQLVTIVVPNEDLQDQFEALISDYCDEKVSVVMPVNMKVTDHNQIYLLDEADYQIEKRAVFFEWNKFDKKGACNELRGLAPAFHAERVYFMSATFDNYQKKLLEKVWGISEDEIRQFKNLATITSGFHTTDFNLSECVRNSEHELVGEIRKKVREEFECPRTYS